MSKLTPVNRYEMRVFIQKEASRARGRYQIFENALVGIAARAAVATPAARKMAETEISQTLRFFYTEEKDRLESSVENIASMSPLPLSWDGIELMQEKMMNLMGQDARRVLWRLKKEGIRNRFKKNTLLQKEDTFYYTDKLGRKISSGPYIQGETIMFYNEIVNDAIIKEKIEAGEETFSMERSGSVKKVKRWNVSEYEIMKPRIIHPNAGFVE